MPTISLFHYVYVNLIYIINFTYLHRVFPRCQPSLTFILCSSINLLNSWTKLEATRWICTLKVGKMCIVKDLRHCSLEIYTSLDYTILYDVKVANYWPCTLFWSTMHWLQYLQAGSAVGYRMYLLTSKCSLQNCGNICSKNVA